MSHNICLVSANPVHSRAHERSKTVGKVPQRDPASLRLQRATKLLMRAPEFSESRRRVVKDMARVAELLRGPGCSLGEECQSPDHRYGVPALADAVAYFYEHVRPSMRSFGDFSKPPQVALIRSLNELVSDVERGLKLMVSSADRGEGWLAIRDRLVDDLEVDL